MPDPEFLRLALSTYKELCANPHDDVYITKLAEAIAQKTGHPLRQVRRELSRLKVWEKLDGDPVLVQYSQGIFARSTDLVLPNGRRYALVRIEKKPRTPHRPHSTAGSGRSMTEPKRRRDRFK